mmetsp:Transcript_3453/g.6770  ORF Transcript_3453/g.6770 Transcript_3453/m.6770 type:complete len:253 (-) Transcript_3453:162-920(-)
MADEPTEVVNTEADKEAEVDKAPKIKIVAQLAMSGKTIAEVLISETDTLPDLRKAIAQAAGETKPLRMVFEGRKLKGVGSVVEAGLTDGAIINMFRGGLPGWTRICHGDQIAGETTGSPLVWDLPIEDVMTLAQRASRVRIQQRGDPEIAVESKAGTYPIENVRSGVPIGFERAVTAEEVQETWEVPEGGDEAMVPAKLWHTNLHWHRANHDKLEMKVYHCCDNGGGIHWDTDVCGWTVAGGVDLELYIDVE